MVAKDQKYFLVNRITERAKSGLNFLYEVLTTIHTGGTDAAFSRSCYILFSYNFELILKSWIILNRNETVKMDLLRGLSSHDLEKLSKEIPENKLVDIDIESIKKKEDNGFIEYAVKMVDDREIVVQDLVDVRYDFVKDNLRGTDRNEGNRMREEVDLLLRIVKKIIEKSTTAKRLI
ncbi:MAG: hypothetical protein AAB539_04085 [Patescibacteria group bacterium]